MYTYRGYRIAPLPSQSQPPPAPPAQQEFFLPLRHGDDIDLRSEFRPDESNNTDPALPCGNGRTANVSQNFQESFPSEMKAIMGRESSLKKNTGSRRHGIESKDRGSRTNSTRNSKHRGSKINSTRMSKLDRIRKSRELGGKNPGGGRPRKSADSNRSVQRKGSKTKASSSLRNSKTKAQSSSRDSKRKVVRSKTGKSSRYEGRHRSSLKSSSSSKNKRQRTSRAHTDQTRRTTEKDKIKTHTQHDRIIPRNEKIKSTRTKVGAVSRIDSRRNNIKRTTIVTNSKRTKVPQIKSKSIYRIRVFSSNSVRILLFYKPLILCVGLSVCMYVCMSVRPQNASWVRIG